MLDGCMAGMAEQRDSSGDGVLDRRTRRALATCWVVWGWRLRDKEVIAVGQVHELDARGADGRGQMGGVILLETGASVSSVVSRPRRGCVGCDVSWVRLMS